MKRVVIIRERCPVEGKAEDYEQWVSVIKDSIDALFTARQHKAAEVWVWDSPDQAIAWSTGSPIDAMHFLSDLRLEEARRVKQNHPRMRVVVWTGNIWSGPFRLDGQVEVIHKGSATRKLIQEHAF